MWSDISGRGEIEKHYLGSDWGNLPHFIEADGVKINIALSNLVKNALQFTERAGLCISAWEKTRVM